MTEPLDVLAIMAHPDDAELLVGGALIKSSDAGERTGVLDLTRGELGSRGTPEIRAREATRASEIMGLAVRRNAGLPDGHLENSLETRKVVAALIRELRPRVVVTHWMQGRHPDHVAAAAIAWDASFMAGLKNFDASGDRHRPDKVVYGTGFREDADPPTFVIDVTDQIDRKMEAVAAYASQFEGVAGMGEIHPAGQRPLQDQIRAVMAHYGSRIRASYGEPYRTRETMAADTLGALRVDSF